MKLEDLIRETAAIETQMHSPADFYAERSGHYLMIAKQIARSVMITMRPPESDPDRWQRRVDEIADEITIRLLSAGNGLNLTLIDRPSGSVNPEVGERSGVEAITFEDVMQWIRDGQEGKPGGKRIEPEDEEAFQSEAGMRGRASIIMKAYYGLEPRPEWQALRNHIQRWMRGEGIREPDKFLSAITAAWQENFGSILADDLRKWLHTLW
jgi:hypothetical protein